MENTLLVFLTLQMRLIKNIWRKFVFNIAWPPVYQSLIDNTWHKHKIVHIFAKIVVTVIVVDWVQRFDIISLE